MKGTVIRILLGGAALAACATGAAWAASASPTEPLSGPVVAMRTLAMHNAERSRVGVPALAWSPRLEREARDWANYLARRGMLAHSHGAARMGVGENLWMGTAGRFPVEAMVGAFIAERRHFRRGAFPHLSRTGNWADVGHYSQLVWRETREVGCAVASHGGRDLMVCRYFPAGNVWGRRPY